MDITEAGSSRSRRSSRAVERVAEPVASSGSVATANPLAVLDEGRGSEVTDTFKRRVRRRTIIGDVGFATYTSGIRAGWYVELGSVKFRQVSV